MTVLLSGCDKNDNVTASEGPMPVPATPQWSREEIAQAQAEYRSLCDIYYKTDPTNRSEFSVEEQEGKPKREVTEEEIQRLIGELGRTEGGCWFTHDFRRMAAITLGNLRVKAAVPKLRALVEDRTQYHMVSAEAAKALGKIGDKEALPSLVQALTDDRTCVRDHAAAAISELSVTDADLKPLITDKRFGEFIAALSRQKIPSIPARSYALAGGINEAGQMSAAETLCWCAIRLKPTEISEENMKQAKEQARRILDSNVMFFIGRKAEEFCKTFEPDLYKAQIQKEKDAESRN
jgi:hypothetical protein